MKKTLKDWELEKGIKVKTRDKSKTYNERQYKKLIKSNYIVTKTEKGLEYLKEAEWYILRIPKIISKNGHEYILVKEYKNFIMYKDMLIGTMECFNRHDLGLIKKQPKISYASKHNIR